MCEKGLVGQMGSQLPHKPKTHLVIAGMSGPGAWLLDPAAYKTETPRHCRCRLSSRKRNKLCGPESTGDP